MIRRVLPLACVVGVACYSQPPLDATDSFEGWDTPDVLVKHEVVSSAAVAMDVTPQPKPVPAVRAKKPSPRSPRFNQGTDVVTNDIDVSGALTTAPSQVAPTTRRATTRRDAVAAPKLERTKAGAVSLTSKSSSIGRGTSSLSIGTSVRRGLSADQIRDVALASMGQVRACYERALKTSPALHGRVVVDWKVAPSGAVSRASIGSDTIGDAGLQSCIIETVKAWTFPESGRSTPVSFPFTLKPG